MVLSVSLSLIIVSFCELGGVKTDQLIFPLRPSHLLSLERRWAAAGYSVLSGGCRRQERLGLLGNKQPQILTPNKNKTNQTKIYIYFLPMLPVQWGWQGVCNHRIHSDGLAVALARSCFRHCCRCGEQVL